MAEMSFESPLRLPPNWTATPLSQRQHNPQFSTNLTLDDALQYLHDEVTLLALPNPTLFSNAQNLNNPRLRKLDPRNQGVALRCGATGAPPMWLACDKWQEMAQNIYALHLTLRALHNIEQWGIAPAHYILESLSQEHTQPSQPRTTHTAILTGQPEWMDVLGLGTTATLEDAHAVYRRRAKLVAQDEEALLALNQAMEEAKRSLR